MCFIFVLCRFIGLLFGLYLGEDFCIMHYAACKARKCNPEPELIAFAAKKSKRRGRIRASTRCLRSSPIWNHQRISHSSLLSDFDRKTAGGISGCIRDSLGAYLVGVLDVF